MAPARGPLYLKLLHHVPGHVRHLGQVALWVVPLRVPAGVQEHGIPGALYTDRAGWAVYTPTSGSAPDRTKQTQVGRALARLGEPGKAVEPVRDAAGTTLTPTPVHARSLESIFGEVEVARTGYGAAGTPSLHPLDGALNLPPEKYSLEVRRRVAIEAAKSSFDEGVETLEAFTTLRFHFFT